MKEIVQVVFPTHAIRINAVDEKLSTEQCSLFTVKELEQVILSMKDKKQDQMLFPAKCYSTHYTHIWQRV